MVTIVGGRPGPRYCARFGDCSEQSLPPGDCRLRASGDDLVWVDGAAFRIAPDGGIEVVSKTRRAGGMT